MADFVSPATVDRLELLRVALEGWTYGGQWTSVPGETFATLTGDSARELLEMVEALPDGDQVRCFVPTYGLRAWDGDTIVGEAAICFRCHNAVTRVGGERGWFRFDVGSAEARRLLEALRAYDPAKV